MINLSSPPRLRKISKVWLGIVACNGGRGDGRAGSNRYNRYLLVSSQRVMLLFRLYLLDPRCLNLVSRFLNKYSHLDSEDRRAIRRNVR